MQLKKVLVTLFFLTTIWCLFLFGFYFTVKSSTLNAEHIPENADFAVRLNTANTIKAAGFSILLEANDPDVTEILNKKLNNKWLKDSSKKSLGIDLKSDYIAYVFPFEDIQLLGISYNLKQPEWMQKNASELLDSNAVYAVNGNIGVVLRNFGRTVLSKEKKKKAKKMAQQIAKNKSKGPFLNQVNEVNSGQLLQFTSKGLFSGKSADYSRTNLKVSLDDKTIKLSGEIVGKTKKSNPKSNDYTLTPNGVHVFNALIPENLQEHLKNLLSSTNFTFPEIQSFAMNYRGMSINNPEGILLNSPDMDLILNFKDTIDFIARLANSPLLTEFHMTMKNAQTFSNGINDYHITKLSSKSFLISTLKHVQPHINQEKELFSLEGNMNKLTEIEGDKWILMFLSNLPLYQNTQLFLTKIDEAKIKVTSTTNGHAEIKGNLDFKSIYSPMNEIFKFGVQSNLIQLN